MKTIFYTTLFSFLLLGLFSSCVKKTPKETEDAAVIVYDTPARSETVQTQEVKKEVEKTPFFRTDDYYKLKKYSVVAATLTQPNGVNALKSFFDRDGINHFVVRGPESKYFFIIYSSDSEEDAMRARSEFLVRNTVNKSRDDIWHQYYIQLTDTFILEK